MTCLRASAGASSAEAGRGRNCALCRPRPLRLPLFTCSRHGRRNECPRLDRHPASGRSAMRPSFRCSRFWATESPRAPTDPSGPSSTPRPGHRPYCRSSSHRGTNRSTACGATWFVRASKPMRAGASAATGQRCGSSMRTIPGRRRISSSSSRCCPATRCRAPFSGTQCVRMPWQRGRHFWMSRPSARLVMAWRSARRSELASSTRSH